MYTATRATIVRRIEYDDYALIIMGENHKPGEVIEPTARLIPDSAQALFETMWQMGFRPRGEKSNEHLNAVTRHLNHVSAILDMVLPLALSDEVRPQIRLDQPSAMPERIRRPSRRLAGEGLTDSTFPTPGMVVAMDEAAMPATSR